MDTSDTKTVQVAPGATLWLDDVAFEAIRASGPGGQNVNKVATAVQLRYDLRSARLPDALRARLLARSDARISGEGVVVIKAQRHRTQARNREDALERLVDLLREAAQVQKRRIATKPGRGAREKRLKKKGIKSKNKSLRKTPALD